MKLIVNPHKIEIIKEPVNEREIDITKCEFEFADEITNDYVKEAYFTFGGNSYKQIIVNNECDIPSEVLAKSGQVEIGVVAFLVQNEEEIKRYNPSPAYFNTWVGSLKNNAENSEPITPSEMEQYEQALQDGLTEVNGKLDDIDQALTDVNTAITETNNLNLDVTKEGKTATVTLTKKDASTKVVTLSDGTSLMFNWEGTSLGIKTDEDEDYTYVDLQGVQGETGPMGAPFTIKKTYSSVAEMNADFNNMQLGDYVMIASTVEIEDNAKLYTRGEEQWIFISDFSGAQGIKGETGATPNIQIGTVTSGQTPSVTRTGTNENPVLNFVLEKGDKGDTGNTGPTGATGNGIASIAKTSTSGLVDTYTITYTDGQTTTFTVTNGEDGEVTQAQLDETNARVERAELVYNALPKVSGEGTELTINDTAECPMPMSLAPSELEQETTTGKNLMPFIAQDFTVNNIRYYVQNGSLIFNGTSTGETYINNYNFKNNFKFTLLAGTYTISHKLNVLQLRLCKYSDDSTVKNLNIDEANGTFTLVEDTEVFLGFSVYQKTFNNVNAEIMLEQNSTATDYEPYTGGVASPNPNYPQDIHTISGDNEIKVENKNLFNKNTYGNNYRLAQDGTGYGDTGYYTSVFIKVKPNTIYTKNSPTQDAYHRFAFYATNSANEFISVSSSNTVTTPANCNYIRFCGLKTELDTAMLVRGNTVGNYQPYSINSLPLTLGNLEYCKIGNYADEFYKATESDTGLVAGKWYLKKNIGKIKFDGSEDNWAKMSGTVSQWAFRNNDVTQFKIMSIFPQPIYSNYFVPSQNGSVTNSANGTVWFNETGIGIRFKDTSIGEIDDFKTWLSTHNTSVYAPLAIPDYILLNDTLQTQLTEIYERAISYQDQTNISQVNNDLPFNIKAKAVRDMSSIFELISGTEL